MIAGQTKIHIIHGTVNTHHTRVVPLNRRLDTNCDGVLHRRINLL